MDQVRDYKKLMLSLFPPGRFWEIEDDSPLSSVLDVLAQELHQVDQTARHLLRLIHSPSTWESLLQLTQYPLSPEKRKTIRESYFKESHPLTGKRFTETLNIFGLSGRVIEKPQQGLIEIHLPLELKVFHVGRSSVGSPLQEWSRNQKLEAFVNQIKPAHIRARFIYRR